MSNNMRLRSVPSSGDVIATASRTSHTPSHGDGNGGGDDMLERVKKLEEQMLSLITDAAIIKSNYVTKADLHEEISKQTKWIAATIIGTTAAALAVARLLF